MFREAIEHTLQFVGVHRTDAGCTSSTLSDFLEQDVLPSMGWGASASLRTSIVRVALQESYTTSLLVYAAASELVASLGEESVPSATASETKTSVTTRRRRLRRDTIGVDLTAGTAAPRPRKELVLLPLETVLRLLDEDRVVWTSRGSSAAADVVTSSSSDAAAAGTSSSTVKGGRGRGRLTRATAQATTATTPTASHPGCVQLHVCPTLSLRQRVLGAPLHTETIRSACDYLSDAALHGYDLVHAVRGEDRFGPYKGHLVTAGIRTLLKQQLACRCYLYDTEKQATCYRVFPLYAAPLTELDKRALTANGRDTGTEPQDDSPLFPWELLRRQASRAWRPLDHYFDRQRRLSGCFPAVAFDLTLVKYMVQTSPEHKLLFTDALRAVLGAHGIAERGGRPVVEGVARRREGDRMRKMFGWAGLRVVQAFVVSRGRRRRVRVVMTAEDLQQRLEAQRAREAQRQHRNLQKRMRAQEATLRSDRNAAATTSAAAVTNTAEQGGDDGGDDDDGDAADEEDEEGEVLIDPAAEGNSDDEDRDGARGGSSDSSQESDDDSGTDDEDDDTDADTDGESTRPSTKATRGSSVAPVTASLQRRLEAADHILYISPDWPFELQAGREAERRPLLATRIVPNMAFDGGYRGRERRISAYMTQYVAQRGTIATYSIITRNSRKSLTRVFEPLHATQQQQQPQHQQQPNPTEIPPLATTTTTTAAAAAVTAVTAVKSEETTACDAKGESKEAPATAPPPTTPAVDTAVMATQVNTTPAAEAADSKIPAAAPALSASPPSKAPPPPPPLPKGLAQYSVDVVLGALAEAPHKALSIGQLSKVVDVRALNLRVLPYLRQTKRIYTTGVTSSVRKRIGIVVLNDGGPPLDEAAKLAIVDGDPDAKRQPRQTLLDRFLKGPTSTHAPTTRVVATDLVLPTVPAMIEGLAPSAWAQKLSQVTSRATRYANTLMQIRNGYSAFSDGRAGRLHLELWRQWWCRGGGAAQQSFSLSFREVVLNMTLSTYCIVFGVAAADVVSLVQCARIRWRSDTGAAANASDDEAGDDADDNDDGDEDDDNDGRGRRRRGDRSLHGADVEARRQARQYVPSSSGAADTTVSWDTPLHALPLIVRQWCGVVEMVDSKRESRDEEPVGSHLYEVLLQQLQPLAQHRLIALEDGNVGEVVVAAQPTTRLVLRTSGGVRRGYTYTFYEPYYTTTSTLLAVLQCWAYRWQHLQTAPIRGSRSMCLAEPDPSFAALLAVQKYIRVSLPVLGRVIYQHAGFNSNLSRLEGTQLTRRWRAQRVAARRERPRRLAGTHGGTAETSIGALRHGAARVGRQRADGARQPRLYIDVLDVAESITDAFNSTAPQRRLGDLVQMLDRGRRAELSGHPLHVSVSGRAGVNGAAAATAAAAGASAGHVRSSEHALQLMGRDAVAYNPLLRASVLHLATLGRTLNAVRETRLSAPWWSKKERASAAASLASSAPARSLVDVRHSAESVMAPDLTVKTGATKPRKSTASDAQEAPRAGPQQIAERLAAIGRLLAVPCPPQTSSSQPLTSTAYPTQGGGGGGDLAECGEAVPLVELAEDVLRMILLTDRAHYSVSIARTLLLKMPRLVVAKARASLQRCVSFRSRTRPGSRIPGLELSWLATLFPNAPTAQPCANVALLHALTAQTDATANQCSLRPHWSREVLHYTSTAPSSAMEVDLRAQPTLHLAHAEDGDEVRRELLRLPALNWPHAAAELELERLRSGRLNRHGRVNTDGEAPRTRHGRRRPRQQATAKGAAQTAAKRKPEDDDDGEEEEHNNNDDDDDEDDDDDDDDEVKGGARASVAVEHELYPARRLGSGMDTASRIPAAPAASPAEQQAVLAAIESLEAQATADASSGSNSNNNSASAAAAAVVRLRSRSGGCRVLSDFPDGCLAYPSIFHHVDGAFHPFVWQTFLTGLYRFVQYVPGIEHTDLMDRLMAPGLVSRRAAHAGINHLVLSGVLRRTHVGRETLDNTVTANDARLRVSADFSDDATRNWSWAYHVTVPSSGMWDLTQLDSTSMPK